MEYQHTIPNEQRARLAAAATSAEIVYSVLVAPEHDRAKVIKGASRTLLGLSVGSDISELPASVRGDALYIMRTLRDHIAELGGPRSPWRRRKKVCFTRVAYR